MAEVEPKATAQQEVDYKALYEQSQSDLTKYKSSIDRLAGENADYKRKERERMSEEEKSKAEMQEKEAYYKKLEKENALHRYSAKFAKTIQDETVVSEIASLYAEGKVDEAIDKQNEYFIKQRAELEKTIKADLMRENPQPQPITGGATMTKDEIMAIKDPIARQSEIAKNINLFK